MTESVLDSVKKVLGIDASYTAFDVDILMHINSTFSKLSQLGVLSHTGSEILDNTTTWEQLFIDRVYNMAKTYTCLQVRMWFDPPAVGHHVEALKEQIRELEWRLNTHREGEQWEPPPIL